MNIGYMTTEQAQDKWGIKKRRITNLLNEGRVQGAVKLGKIWIIPVDAKKPEDMRKFNGAHMKKVSVS